MSTPNVSGAVMATSPTPVELMAAAAPPETRPVAGAMLAMVTGAVLLKLSWLNVNWPVRSSVAV